MLQLFRYWLDLCLLRAAPQDGPASAFVLGFSLTCYAMVSVLVLSGSYGMMRGVQLAFIDLLVMVVFVLVMLYLSGKSARSLQTLSALSGAGTLLGLLALPLVLMTGPASTEASVPFALTLVWLLLSFWNLVVSAHIIRHALSTSLAIGVAMALLYVLISMQFAATIIPLDGNVTTGETGLSK
ncbi:MAG TPA: hypothetical protein VLB10_00185 [Gammaproteobacteria bacterium]|jgi:hypothetical protein|nr:hypothetical protein [Gammaproteobacteria bacterium]